MANRGYKIFPRSKAFRDNFDGIFRKKTMKEITYDEIELVKESACDGCKGMFYLHESGCYESCEAFQAELREIKGITE